MSPQGSPEWMKERAGHATASCFRDILARVKVGEAATRRKLRVRLVTERLTGIPIDGYQSAAMLWGTATEPQARMAYEAATGAVVLETGFLLHPAIEWCGASPDGLIGDDGLLELKCPESQTHLEWLEAGAVPSEHIPQIQGQMAVTGRQWVDFCSFDPRFPEHLQLFIVRVKRDDAYIEDLQKQIRVFLAEVEQMETRLRTVRIFREAA